MGLYIAQSGEPEVEFLQALRLANALLFYFCLDLFVRLSKDKMKIKCECLQISDCRITSL